MVRDIQKPLVLVLGDPPARAALSGALEADVRHSWDVREGHTLEQASLLLEVDALDVVLVDLPGSSGLGCLGSIGLADHAETLLLLVDDEQAGEQKVAALPAGARWLARKVALDRPEILGAILSQMVRLKSLQEQLRVARARVEEHRQQTERLADLLLTLPVQGGRWLSHRHMMQRLSEEIARARRYNAPLAVVLGEIEKKDVGSPHSAAEVSWLVSRINESKRLGDVAGMYGLSGFMLLLPETTTQGATIAASRLRSRLQKSHAPLDGPADIEIHLGVAGVASSTFTATGLLSQAEEQLEQSRSRLVFGGQMRSTPGSPSRTSPMT